MVLDEKRAFFVFMALIAVCLTPGLGNTQVFEPSHDYPLSDYTTYGMLFGPKYQKVVENLTKQLLDNERSAGYFGGANQEEVIRDKVKKHIAMSRGLCDRKAVEKDDATNQAVRATKEYFKKWRDQMPEPTNTAEIRAVEEKRYQAVCNAIKDQQDAREDYERRRRAPKQYSPEQLKAIYEALDAKHAEIDRIENFLNRRSCEDYCYSHQISVNLGSCLGLCGQLR